MVIASSNWHIDKKTHKYPQDLGKSNFYEHHLTS
jgi:hypothetical protein